MMVVTPPSVAVIVPEHRSRNWNRNGETAGSADGDETQQ